MLTELKREAYEANAAGWEKNRGPPPTAAKGKHGKSKKKAPPPPPVASRSGFEEDKARTALFDAATHADSDLGPLFTAWLRDTELPALPTRD